jgi:hypothetical protein
MSNTSSALQGATLYIQGRRVRRQFDAQCSTDISLKMVRYQQAGEKGGSNKTRKIEPFVQTGPC